MFVYLAYLVILFILVSILYLLAIMPKIKNRDLTSIMGVHYAHRGFHSEHSFAPENSMKAFKLALEKSYGIELDVQLSKDGQPVVFHDFTLKRMCGINKNIRDFTFDELREFTLYDSNEKIPHLKEVLDLVDGQVPLIVELKVKARDMTICNVVSKLLDDYHGVYCIESFNPVPLIWYKKNRPDVIRGQLSTNYRGKKGTINDKVLNFMLQNLLFNFITKPDFIAFNYKYSNLLSLKICKHLYKTNTVAWTITSSESLKDNKQFFDLFIFENFIPE